MKIAATVLLALGVVACTGAAPPTPTPAQTATPISPTAEPPQTAEPQPTATPATGGRLDGVWASDALQEADFLAALDRASLESSGLPEWLGDWSQTTTRHVESEIKGGRFINSEYSDGVITSGFEAPMEFIDDNTILLTDEEADCGASMGFTRSGDELTFEVLTDDCPNDLEAMTVLFESSPFRLIQEASWAAPAPTPAATLDPSAAPPTRAPSTSGTRQVAHPIGTVEGAPLGYLEYLPPDYGSEPAPLLVDLHGASESGDGSDAALSVLARGGIPSIIKSSFWPDERPFVVLAPQHEEDPPSFCMEPDEIDAFLRFALEHYDVDPARVYLTGLSCGAIGLWNYLGEYGNELVAAAVPMAGNGVAVVEERGCDLGQTPIWAFHGERDLDVFVRGSVYPISELQDCSDPAPVDARVTVYPNGDHDAWTRTYNGTAGYDIYGWLLGHHK